MEHTLRPPAVAGMFYPGQPEPLRQQVDELLRKVPSGSATLPRGTPPSRSPLRAPKAMIVPHAGYIYSGPTAAYAYRDIALYGATITRVVLLGPCHRVALRGIAVPSVAAFSTPLGSIPLDREAIDSLMALPQVQIHDAAHAPEHSLEVQLPFLQRVLGTFRLVPLAVGAVSAAEVAEVIEHLWGGAETLILISSDLSHFHSYDDARRRDHATVTSILELHGLENHEQACGATPVNGLLLVARRHDLRPRLLDLRNSGDTAGDRERVVGYTSIAFEEASRD